ncbi:MAG: hypothetical protein P8Z50_06985, partial [candidate division WOR-3 bacterium]
IKGGNLLTPKRKFFVDGVRLASLEDIEFNPPDFLSVQRDSFEKFILLEYNGDRENRPDIGLESVFREVFPIEDIHGRYKIE